MLNNHPTIMYMYMYVYIHVIILLNIHSGSFNYLQIPPLSLSIQFIQGHTGGNENVLLSDRHFRTDASVSYIQCTYMYIVKHHN